MFQIWYYLTLLIILGSCEDIEHGSVLPSSLDSIMVNEINKPRLGETCSRRGSQSRLGCHYCILFGHYVNYNRNYSDTWYLPLESQNGSSLLEVAVPKDNATNNLVISYIKVEDSQHTRRVWYDNLRIVEGGIGDERVKMIIKSNYPHLSNYSYIAKISIDAKDDVERMGLEIKKETNCD